MRSSGSTSATTRHSSPHLKSNLGKRLSNSLSNSLQNSLNNSPMLSTRGGGVNNTQMRSSGSTSATQRHTSPHLSRALYYIFYSKFIKSFFCLNATFMETSEIDD